VRIAHVSDCYAPRTGGIESQVRSLALQQQAGGHDLRIITATPGHEGVFAGIDEVDGLRVHRVAARVPFELPVHPRTRLEVGRVLDDEPVDVVHVHAGVVSPFAWGAVRAARERRVPVVVTVHSVWGPVAGPAFSLTNALAHWSRWGVTFSAVSRLAAEQIARAVPDVGEVLVIPNGIDASQWQVAHAGAGRDRLRVVTVMRLAPRKRTMPLLRIIAQARRELDGRVDVSATIVGDGPVLERARSYVRRNGLEEAVRLTGRLNREGVRQVLGSSDVYVQPSVRESFGLAALEARTAGLPVIVRSQSGSTQFIHDQVEGLVVDDDAGVVRALVRLGHDRDLLDSITRHNQMTPPAEVWPQVLESVTSAYRRAGA